MESDERQYRTCDLSNETIRSRSDDRRREQASRGQGGSGRARRGIPRRFNLTRTARRPVFQRGGRRPLPGGKLEAMDALLSLHAGSMNSDVSRARLAARIGR